MATGARCSWPNKFLHWYVGPSASAPIASWGALADGWAYWQGELPIPGYDWNNNPQEWMIFTIYRTQQKLPKRFLPYYGVHDDVKYIGEGEDRAVATLEEAVEMCEQKAMEFYPMLALGRLAKENGRKSEKASRKEPHLRNMVLVWTVLGKTEIPKGARIRDTVNYRVCDNVRLLSQEMPDGAAYVIEEYDSWGKLPESERRGKKKHYRVYFVEDGQVLSPMVAGPWVSHTLRSMAAAMLKAEEHAKLRYPFMALASLARE